MMLACYVCGFLITGRAAYVYFDRHDLDPAIDRSLAVAAGVIWPIVVAIAVVYGLLWLTIFRPTRRQRREKSRDEDEEMNRLSRQFEHEYGLPPLYPRDEPQEAGCPIDNAARIGGNAVTHARADERVRAASRALRSDRAYRLAEAGYTEIMTPTGRKLVRVWRH